MVGLVIWEAGIEALSLRQYIHYAYVYVHRCKNVQIKIKKLKNVKNVTKIKTIVNVE